MSRLSGEILRRDAYLALEGGRLGGPVGLVVEAILVTLIVLNVIAYTLQSIPRYERDYADFFYLFEIVSLVVFSVEYALRLWTATEDPSARERGPFLGRIYYATRPLMVIDFFAIAPSIAALFVPFLDLRVLRLFRLLRLLKIARYSPALSALARVITDERRALYGSLLLFLCALLLFAAAMHAVEGGMQPAAFGTIPDALWWAVSTLTTTGYGDVVPLTPLGRMLAGVAMIVGLGLAALPVGIVATGFTHSIHRRDFVVTFGMVARVPIFQGLDAKTLSEIMDLLRAFAVSEGDIVSAHGERAALDFIIAGEVEAQTSAGPLRYRAGEFFGELARSDDRLRDSLIVAVTPTRFLELSISDFEQLVRRHPGLREEMERLAGGEEVDA
jgi:voltage-gated potassium channel